MNNQTVPAPFVKFVGQPNTDKDYMDYEGLKGKSIEVARTLTVWTIHNEFNIIVVIIMHIKRELILHELKKEHVIASNDHTYMDP